MKPRVSLLLLAGLFSAGSLSAKEKVEPGAEPNHAVLANNALAVDLYRQLVKENAGQNIFFSPYSILSALSMTAEGAREETALQMGEVLGFSEDLRKAAGKLRPWNMVPVHSGIGELNGAFNDEGKKPYVLSVANAIWGERTYPFNKAFIGTINGSYGTNSLQPADFIGDPEAERKRVNDWVEKATLSKIKDLLPEGSVDIDTRMVLANAIYFKADWSSAFSEKRTSEKAFKLSSGEAAKVPMMYQRDMEGGGDAAFNGDGSFFPTKKMTDFSVRERRASYPDEHGFVMAELPYHGGDLSMVLLVPQSASSIGELEEKLTSENINRWLGHLEKRDIHITMPKFRSETTYNLNDTLSKMGMPAAFTDGANFDGMIEGESNAKLFIGLVMHKAFIEVNEEGTEAAAATAVVVKTESAAITEPFVPFVNADKPFLYLIRDAKSGTILFMGKIENPAS